jgi:alcohol dehydrogenase (cytochrome c)
MRVPKRVVAFAALCACALLAVASRPHAAAPVDPAFETLANLVAAKMREYQIPGVAMGVLRNGETTIRGFGVTSLEDGLPVTADTIFPLASISKTVTSTAVMRLVEQGKIDLRAPVRTYLPDFRVQDAAASRDVTVGHLLTHTSGWEGQLSAIDRGDETLARFVDGLSSNMQLAPPGAAWSYNNAAFAVAGRIVEVVTGMPFGDAVNDLVFKPVGLSRAFTRVGDIVTHRFALGHRVGAGGGTPAIIRPFTLGSTLPAGGVAMSMDNLLAYARFHLGDGTGADGARVLTRATLEQMRSPQLRKQAYDDDMGIGWHLRTVGDTRTAAHGGTFAGHILLLELVPEKNSAFAILTNAGSGWRLIQDVERAALKAYHGATFRMNQAISHRGLNETLPAVTPLPTQPDVTPYVGRYVRPMNAVVTRAENGRLIVQVRPNTGAADAEMPVAFYGPDRAVVTAGPEQGASVEFIRGSDGSVQWVRVTGRIARREQQATSSAGGAALFQRSCASCHNVEGRAPSLATGVFAHGSADAQIAQTIRAGVPGTQMPPFPALADEDVRQLVAYIRSLSSSAGAPPAPAAAVAPAGLGDGGLTFARLRRAASEPQNWLTYWGDYQGTHYSGLQQIDASNVRRLQAAWARQLPGSSVLEATPLVVDGVMYTSGPPGVVVALDAATGKQIWRSQRTQKIRNPNEINPFNRGVAVLGNRVFVGTLDAALLALDARTGALLWDVQMADPMQGFSITSPPLPIDGKIIAGIAGGEFGIRGFIDAYDPATGARLWRFHTIPGPGEFGHDTWTGDSWKLGCGATWLPGSYDPDLNLLYWATGNPCPLYNGAVRAGDNLFTSSVVALDPATGERKWHYQFSPHDTHDWDSNQDMILVDRVFRGQPRKLLMHADRNGHVYLLDRTNGTFLAATPFTTQTWNSGFDANGRPILTAGAEASAAGSVVSPTIGGATNFQAPSYSPSTGWVYLAYQAGAQRYISETQPFESGRQYPGGRGASASQPRSAGIKAIDPESGKTVWDFPLTQGSLTSGVLATAGGVVFAASREGFLFALDARTGTSLWRFQTGTAIDASPISYSVGGRQFVAVSAGNVVYTFALPE